MNAMMITGGAGFIGSCFVRRTLSSRRVTLINVDNLTYAGNLESLGECLTSPRHVFVKSDICDGETLAEQLEIHQPSCIVHFAAESHVDRSIHAPTAFVQTNVLGTQKLLDAALAYWKSLDAERAERFRFLHVSTDEVYGSLGDNGKFTEKSPYAPNSPYSASKAASDHLVRAYHHTYGLPTLITNCSNNYGPFQFPEKLIPLMTLNAMQGKTLPIYGDGRNVRDWLYVEDHCRAIECVLEKGEPGSVYNVGGNAEKTNLEVVKTICDIVDELCPSAAHRPSSSLIEFVEDRPGHDRRYAIDATKISKELGWSPRVTFEDGIRETVKWYLQHPEWVEHVCDGSYQRERLGLLNLSEPVLCANSIPAKEYRDGVLADVDIETLATYRDHRGWLLELFRSDELPADNLPAMAYVSETLPGVARGPHEHYDQSDCFAFIGPGDFELYLWDSRPSSPTYGCRQVLVCGESNPTRVIVPPGVVHAYKNVGSTGGIVYNAPNRLYAGEGKLGPVDEIRHEDDGNSPYALTSNQTTAKAG